MIAAIFFLAMGLRAVLSPIPSSAFFGVPVEPGPGLAFVRTTGGRNIGIAITALALIWVGARAGLIAILLSSGIVAAIDAYSVSIHAGLRKSIKHVVYVVLLASFAIWIGIDGIVK
jgi:hypothetical protein